MPGNSQNLQQSYTGANRMGLTYGGLFEGIGGFALAAQTAGIKPLWSNEIDPFCCQVLRHHFNHEIKEGDIRETEFEPVDVLCGGFPCQGFSHAGLRRGTKDNRYLWPEMFRVIQQTKPSWVIAENVTGILTMEDESGIRSEVFARVEGRTVTRFQDYDQYEAVYIRQSKMLIESICEDLEEAGYEVHPVVIPAASVGAPHKRERIWIIANTNKSGANTRHGKVEKVFGEVRQSKSVPEFGNAVKVYATDTDRRHRPKHRLRPRRKKPKGSNKSTTNSNTQGKGLQGSRTSRRGWPGSDDTPKGPTLTTGTEAWKGFSAESPFCSGNDGISERLDNITFSSWRVNSIKALGNAIVPQVAYEILHNIVVVNKNFK